jgi:hypothetical protein
VVGVRGPYDDVPFVRIVFVVTPGGTATGMSDLNLPGDDGPDLPASTEERLRDDVMGAGAAPEDGEDMRDPRATTPPPPD